MSYVNLWLFVLLTCEEDDDVPEGPVGDVRYGVRVQGVLGGLEAVVLRDPDWPQWTSVMTWELVKGCDQGQEEHGVEQSKGHHPQVWHGGQAVLSLQDDHLPGAILIQW